MTTKKEAGFPLNELLNEIRARKREERKCAKLKIITPDEFLRSEGAHDAFSEVEYLIEKRLKAKYETVLRGKEKEEARE